MCRLLGWRLGTDAGTNWTARCSRLDVRDGLDDNPLTGRRSAGCGDGHGAVAVNWHTTGRSVFACDRLCSRGWNLVAAQRGSERGK